MKTNKRSFGKFQPAVLAIVLGLVGSAKADPIYWAGNTAANPGVGWGTLANWSTSSGATTPNPSAVPTNTDDVVFNITPSNSVACNLYLGGDQAANSLTFNSTGAIQIFGNASGTAARVLTLGAGGITINPGAGQNLIGGASATYGTINVTIAASQTWLNNSTAANFLVRDNGTTAITINSGQTLTFSGSGNTYVGQNVANANITGSGALAKSGSGLLQLYGVNTYTNGTTLNAGTLQLGNASALGTGPLTITGGSLDVTTGISMGNIAQNWNGDFTFVGTANLTIGNGAVTMNGDRQVTVNASTLTCGGAIGDGGSGYRLSKLGSGTLMLSASNTYSGPTLISAGTLTLSSGGSLASVLITNNGTFTVSSVAGGYHLKAGKTLFGAGTVAGAMTVDSGATNTIGGSTGTSAKQTMTGNQTFKGTTVLRLDKGNSTNDVIAVSSGSLTLGGTLEVHLVNGAVNTGDQFQLFNSTNIIVGAVIITGDVPTTGGWDTSSLGSGILKVTASAPSFTLNGGTGLVGATNQCSVTLSVNPSGTAPVTNYWYVNGVLAASGASLNSFTLSPATGYPYSVTPYSVTVTATNAYGSDSSGPVNALLNDTTPPTITLSGANPMGVLLNSTYVEPGATASDNCTLASFTTNSSAVNTAVLGTYTVTYTAVDGNANTTISNRTVVVVSSYVWTNLSNGLWSNAANWQNGLIASSANVPADFTTLTMAGPITVTNNGAVTVGGLWFDDQSVNKYAWTVSGSGSLTLAVSSGSPVISNNVTTTISERVAGSQGMNKTGTGTLTLASPTSTANSITPYLAGTTTINHGALKIDTSTWAGGASKYALGTNSVGATLELYGTNASIDAIMLTSSNTVISGSGTINKTGTGYLDIGGGLGVGAPSIKNFSGQINVQQGCLGENVTDWTNSAGLMSLDISANAYFDLRVGDVVIDKLTGAGVVGTTYNSPANKTLTVGNNNGSATFSGVISNAITIAGYSTGGTIGLTKTGTGTQTLSGINTYTGPTTVSNGTLAVNGSLAAGSVVTVTANGALAGSGIISGPVTVNGTLAPGTNGGVATLTINNNLTLAGNLFFKVDKSQPVQSNDIATVTGALNNTGIGTLTMTNLNPSPSFAFANGDKFTLFSQPLANGAAMTISPSSPGPGLAWTNNLALDGSIGVYSANSVNTTPTKITVSVSGSTLTLSWPADHLGWHLQMQTNSLATGLKTNGWVVIPGTDLVTTTNFSITKTNPTVFYRMTYP
jgi:autotransporter-associated beta strand protein